MVVSDIFPSFNPSPFWVEASIGRCDSESGASNVVCPFCKRRLPRAALLTFLTLYSLYVEVLGITSSRNCKFSIRATAFAFVGCQLFAKDLQPSRRTHVLVLNIAARFLLRFDHIHCLLGKVAYEHFLKLSLGAGIMVGNAGVTVAMVIAKAPLLEQATISSSMCSIFLTRATASTISNVRFRRRN